MADDEEVVELDMPRPRSISRNPQARRPQSPDKQHPVRGAPVNRRQSDAQKLHAQSLVADNKALANITRDLNVQLQAGNQSSQQEIGAAPDSNKAPETPIESREDGDYEQTKMVDDDFRAKMNAVSRAEIEAVRNNIRADDDSSIRPDGPPSSVTASSLKAASVASDEKEAYLTNPGNPLHEARAPHAESASPEIAAILAGLHLNPTYDQQYASHQGSRGITPPPGFDDLSVPSYQDSSAVPPYAKAISQSAELPLESSQVTGGPLPESDRPPETDKFMSAHIARHGAASLSPLALLTPDQGDMLPVYAQSGMTVQDSDMSRGRTRSEQPAYDTPESRELAKTMEAVEAVRTIEEYEALAAIEAVEALRADDHFDPQQRAAMQAIGDDPSNYFSPEELLQYQRLGSDPGSDEGRGVGSHFDDEAELLQMMAQYARRSPSQNAFSNQAGEQLEEQMSMAELENMLRDRSLTQNQRFLEVGNSAQAARLDHNDFRSTDPDILTILQSSARLPDAYGKPSNQIIDSDTQAALDLFTVQTPDSASTQASLERPPTAQSSNSTTPRQKQQSAGYGGGHHVKRTTMEPAAYSALQERNAKKAESYIALEKQVNALRQLKDYSRDAFELTTKLLLLNPEYYTIWNYRREIMLHGLFPILEDNAKQSLLSDELKKLQTIMKDFPKVYWIWTHRKWCLVQCPWPDWSRELLLVTKMLEQDARNFHVWEYRRYVISQIEAVEESSKAQRELEYTTAAINSNFSNFSAWHNRTKLIPQILRQIDDNDIRESRRRELLQQELDLIKGAIYTDPDDQSVWLYHRWLLNPDSAHASLHPLAPADTDEHVQNLRQELEMIAELMEEEPENVWCTYAKVNYGLAVRRLTGHDPNDEEMEGLRNLISVLENNDDLRKGRYQDWHASTFQGDVQASDAQIPTASNPQLAFAVFADLKARSEWSDVKLNDDGHMTANRMTSNGNLPFLVVPGWSSLQASSNVMMQDKLLASGRLLVGEVQSDRVRYFTITEAIV